MKYLVTATSAIVIAAWAANAGSLEPVAAEAPVMAAPVAAVAQISDWSGPYVGVMAGWNGGENDYGGGDTYDLEGYSGGLLAGYNMQSGNLVYGGELGLAMGNVFETGYENEYEFGLIGDLKGRLGYSLGRAMVFGVAGVSAARFDAGGDEATMTGFNYGLGADAKVSERLVVGAEYLIRDMSGDFDDYSIDSSLSTLSLRGLYRF